MFAFGGSFMAIQSARVLASSVSASRRGFLLGATGLVLSGSALAAPATWRERHRPKGAGASQADWAQLAKALTHGKLLRPDDPDFHQIVQPNNLRYADIIPQGVARCGAASDVAAAIGWAREFGVPLVTRGGGHSYAGYSMTPGLMIETAWISSAAYDVGAGVLRVGAGARNRDLYRLLRLHGRAMTHGRCPSVGAAGFLLGGGIGFNMRAHGVAADQLVGSEMVLADGRLRKLSAKASDDLDRDLFWASQGGGGGNFGISTGFALKTFDVSRQRVTVFDLTWKREPDTPCKVPVEEIGAKLMAVLETSPTKLGSRVSFGAVKASELDNGYDVSISLLGQYMGPADELKAILAPVYALCPPNRGRGIEEKDYWPGQDFLHEEGEETFYQERSAFVTHAFGPDALAAGFEFLRRKPEVSGYCDLRFFQTGGEMNVPKAKDTAFVHRDSRWLMVVGLYWNHDDQNDPETMKRAHAWQNAFYDRMRPLAGGGAYQNFTDPSLTDYRQAYYGQNLDRLAAIKGHVDRSDVFRFPQSI